MLFRSGREEKSSLFLSEGFELIETFLRHTKKEHEAADLESILLSEIPQTDYMYDLKKLMVSLKE